MMAHHKFTRGGLERAGRTQIPLTSFYIGIEPLVIRTLDRTLRFFLKIRARPVLMVLSRLLSFLPTGEVMTTEQATDFMDAMQRLGNSEITVGPCMCQKALGQRKGTYIKDMFVLYGAEAYRKAESDSRDLTHEEAKALLRDLHSEGLVPMVHACMRSMGWAYVLCFCEREICFPFRAHQAAGGVLGRGLYVVALDSEKCVACGTCVERCHFGANSLENGVSEVNLGECYGCGLCVSTCAGGARSMVKREDYRNRYYPLDMVKQALAR
jgi:NAD-dependent dihydropyrimidine dehydrogenase PreA subunit